MAYPYNNNRLKFIRVREARDDDDEVLRRIQASKAKKKASKDPRDASIKLGSPLPSTVH